MGRLYERYTEDNPPIQCFMPDSTWYKGSTQKFVPKGLLWHDTGADNNTLRRYCQPAKSDPNYDKLIELIGKNRNGNDWEHIEKQAGLNCWIGRLADNKTVTTLQAGPWTKRPWGCGSQTRKNGQTSTTYSLNDSHIQWEICEDAKTDIDYFADVYCESIAVSAYLCKKFSIDPQGFITYKGIKVPTIVCHYDAANLGCGSNHGDIYDWTVMYDYLGIPRKSVNISDPYNNAIMQRIRSDIAKAMIDPTPVHTDGWVKTDGKWYYYDNGQMIKADWVKYKGGWYYLGDDGAMLTGWQTIGSNIYYLDDSGRMAQDEWRGKYFASMTGACYDRGGEWHEEKNGKWFGDSTGWYPANRTVMIDGKSYRFDDKGYLVD